jgi:hypothetical protein
LKFKSVLHAALLRGPLFLPFSLTCFSRFTALRKTGFASNLSAVLPVEAERFMKSGIIELGSLLEHLNAGKTLESFENFGTAIRILPTATKAQKKENLEPQRDAQMHYELLRKLYRLHVDDLRSVGRRAPKI